MNTPAHALLNVLALGRGRWERLTPAIAAGGLLPDLPMVVFYVFQKLWARASEQTIWSEAYYRPEWQVFFDLPNSIPILGVLLAVTLYRRWTAGAALLSSMVLHALCDLPLHVDDGHRHFFPLSDWRFRSPISYWDPTHSGLWVFGLELLLMLGATIYLLPRLSKSRDKWIVGGLAAVHLLYVGFVAVVWM